MNFLRAAGRIWALLFESSLFLLLCILLPLSWPLIRILILFLLSLLFWVRTRKPFLKNLSCNHNTNHHCEEKKRLLAGFNRLLTPKRCCDVSGHCMLNYRCKLLPEFISTYPQIKWDLFNMERLLYFHMFTSFYIKETQKAAGIILFVAWGAKKTTRNWPWIFTINIRMKTKKVPCVLTSIKTHKSQTWWVKSWKTKSFSSRTFRKKVEMLRTYSQHFQTVFSNVVALLPLL